jgi:hypothetical protein
MMYVQYPALDSAERLQGLSPFSLSVEDLEQTSPPQTSALLSDFVIEASPLGIVLRAQFNNGQQRTLSLESGSWIDYWDDVALALAAQNYAANRGWSGSTQVSIVERDQWTVQGGYNRHRPLHKFSNDDGQEWYVSSSSGEIVQATTARERFWNWLGAVTHWLYPTALRQHAGVWTQTVIWLTIFALFLTITGITIGVKQFRKRRTGGRSPYRGLGLWHHYSGLIFGIFTLTWLLSGLFSMNPFGALESRSAATERAILNGVNRPLADALDFVRSVSASIPDGTVRLESNYWLGNEYITAFDRGGQRTRISGNGLTGPVSEADVAEAAMGIRTVTATAVELLEAGDDYYYSHHVQRELPVYRVTYEDGEMFYLSAYTGSLLRFVDGGARSYRWLFNALHTGDFNTVTRSRPVWDILLLLLLVGVTTGVATGTYLAIRRVAR